MRWSVIGIGAVLAAVVAAADEPRDFHKVEQALQAVIAKAEPAVACLLIDRESDTVSNSARPDDGSRVPDYYASGVVLNRRGLILTNYHAVRNAKTIRVRLAGPKDRDGVDGPPWTGVARLYAADARSDLAVLELPQSARPFAVLPLGRGEELKKGSFVVSLGFPYASGFRDGSPSASWGIVSNLRRRVPDVITETDAGKLPLQQFGTLIQTDVRLQLGTSGGALLDADGRLVGLTTAAAALTGVDAPGGFAMPMDDMMRRIVDVLLRGEEVEYGFLGVSPAHEGVRRSWRGFEIGGIVGNSPAEKAELHAGDVILKVNGRPIRDRDELFLNLAASLAGLPAELVVQPQFGQERTVRPILVKAQIDIDHDKNRPREESGVATVKSKVVAGLRVEFTSVIKGEANSQQQTIIPHGVLVRDVEGPAKAAGLVPYADIIVRVNGGPVNSPKEFHAKAELIVNAGDSLKLTLADGRTVSLP
jgi:serine protease Do